MIKQLRGRGQNDVLRGGKSVALKQIKHAMVRAAKGHWAALVLHWKDGAAEARTSNEHEARAGEAGKVVALKQIKHAMVRAAKGHRAALVLH